MKIPRSRKNLLELENATLAPYAVHNRPPAAARRFPEEPHPFRTEFQRDRDRILHSRAFRRLEYKTQVFLSGSGDHFRNRLTHTIEVAAIARTIARALGLNADLTEAIALAHDLGHTPFGHAGERAMDIVMADHGGFDHNLQALRVVDLLEIKYPEYNGINLTSASRKGLFKHRIPGESTLDGKLLSPSPSLEAQTADLADDLTYYGHDVDDGLDSGILTPPMLENLEIWKLARETALARPEPRNGARIVPFAIRCLIDSMVGNAIRHSAERLEEVAPCSPEEVAARNDTLISLSPDFLRMTNELKEFLYQKLYFGKELTKLNALSKTRITFLFQYYFRHPDQLGESASSRIEIDGLARAVADHIAGMTDNFAVSEYLRLH